MHRPVFLTGMMGSGKSTVGHILARDAGVPFVDLDQRIERLFGVAIPELFAAGEAHFREHERLALQSLLREPGFAERGVVVATGGGAVLDPDNRAAMDRAGVRVYLEVGLDELERRLRPTVEQGGQAARPLLVASPDEASAPSRLRARLAELLAARRSLYRTGACCVDAGGEPAVVADRVVVALGGEPDDRDDRSRDSEAV